MRTVLPSIPLGKISERREKADPKVHAGEPFIGLDDIEAHTMRLLGWKDAGDLKSSAKKFYKGDVLYSRLRPYLNKVWVADREGLCSSEFIVFYQPNLVDPKFLAYRLNSSDFVAFANSLDTGDRPRVNYKQISVFNIPSISVENQERIVSKIEELFSELDNGIAALKTAREQLKVYRQAILKHAFEGKLTAQWREENKDKLETPEQLLARIQQEREARYQQQIEEWKQAVKGWEARGKEGKKPGRPKALKDFHPLAEDVLAKLAELPDSWSWRKLVFLTTGVEYGTSAKSAASGSVPVIRMGNLQNGSIDWADLVYTSDQEEIDKYSLKKSDVLFNRTNSPELVGKTAKYKGEQPALFAGYLIRINQIETIALADYVNYFLNSYIAKQYGSSVKTDGVNQSNINGEKLQNYPFPFCSIAEQAALVEIIEENMSLTDAGVKDVEIQLEKAEMLRQSILKKAFSGQLTPICCVSTVNSVGAFA